MRELPQDVRAATPRMGPGAFLGWCFLALLFGTSIYLAVNRILQVDEAQQVFQSSILARGWAKEFYTYAPLHHLGPMAWISGHAGSSEAIFIEERLLFLLVFWINLLLLGRICAGTWRPATLLPWLLAASTLAPLWDYGFEIRHDNLLLTGLLLFWFLVRNRRTRPLVAYALTGALAVILQFTAFKSFLYWVPWIGLLLAFPPPVDRPASRFQLGLAVCAGVAFGLVAVRIAYALGGGWQEALSGFLDGVRTSKTALRFSPLPSLGRMVEAMPMVASAAAAFVATKAWDLKVRGRSALGWSGTFPEWLLVLGVMAAFLANPTPFPYNLVFVVPFLLIAASAYWKETFPAPLPWKGSILLACLAAFGQGLPFLEQTLRHFSYTNDHQMEIMDLAESLTDPGRDRIFDGIGLVPTRRTIGYRWQLHTLNLASFQNGTYPSIGTLLSQHPASVILLSYRTDWLSKSDAAFIHAHYLALSDEVLVLGAVLPAGAGSWECIHGGRYFVSPVVPPQGPPETLVVDGRPVQGGTVLELAPGSHRVDTASGHPVSIVWVGPEASLPPSLQPADHSRLFINWY
jgi:hypothetical protein